MRALERAWWRREDLPADRAWLAPLLALEAGFRGAAAARGALYRAGILGSVRAGVPVISVGNLAVGGAGKTPAVMAVAERLRASAIATLDLRHFGVVTLRGRPRLLPRDL